MQYISGLHALNVPCHLETCGDWHLPPPVSEQHPLLWNSERSLFGEEGIEKGREYHGRIYPIANHIRACLDMLQAGDFSNLQGMRHDYICTDRYDDKIFHDVWKMRVLPSWEAIDHFMEKEYLMKWVRFREEQKKDGHMEIRT